MESAQIGVVATGATTSSSPVTSDSAAIPGGTGDPLTTQTIGFSGGTLNLNATPWAVTYDPVANTFTPSGVYGPDFVQFGTSYGPAYKVMNTIDATSGNLTLDRPGIAKYPVPTSTAITVPTTAAYTGNVVLHKSAVVGAFRPPIFPPVSFVQQLPLTDQATGMSFLLCRTEQWGQIMWSVHMAYGFNAVQPAFITAVFG